MEYDVVIGLEVHSELKTKTKVFCSCKNEFGSEPNTNCCPVCIGLPGALPVINKQAVLYAIKAGVALNCKINEVAIMERKNYFYPDMPKAYQISQMVKPSCVGGGLNVVDKDGNTKFIRLDNIHLEEDAGKLVHDERLGGTLVDYNRCGVPLIEIVTMPDMSSADEAVQFLENLKSVLQYLEISDCKMEEGSLRCDVNISLKPKGSEKLGIRAELKNLNSFRSVARAIEYEIKRQSEILDEGGVVVQETRRWDDNAGRSYTMRGKENSQDYRYFPDPDLLPIIVEQKYVDEIKSNMPVLRQELKQKYIEKLGLTEYDADIITADLNLKNFFESVIAKFDKPKFVCNYILTNVLKKVKDGGAEDVIIPINPDNFAKLMELYDGGKISQASTKEVFEIIWENDRDCEEIINEKGLFQNNDEGELKTMIEGLINEFPQSVADYKAGNAKALSFFVGQLMKRTQGKANPGLANKILKELLD